MTALDAYPSPSTRIDAALLSEMRENAKSLSASGYRSSQDVADYVSGHRRDFENGNRSPPVSLSGTDAVPVEVLALFPTSQVERLNAYYVLGGEQRPVSLLAFLEDSGERLSQSERNLETLGSEFDERREELSDVGFTRQQYVNIQSWERAMPIPPPKLQRLRAYYALGGPSRSTPLAAFLDGA
ncbi:hypothetical protein RRSWK_06947 [Rhodopirellula sp. SWK7]|nr:hypothetical protein RRSWK_06947 [Rhodopirellula sp. SWK7]